MATIRTDELEPHHEVMTHLAELERGERVDRIDLERLDRDDLVRLIADELGRAPEPDLAARIWERTGGNPFYAEQVLAAARERPTASCRRACVTSCSPAWRRCRRPARRSSASPPPPGPGSMTSW